MFQIFQSVLFECGTSSSKSNLKVAGDVEITGNLKVSGLSPYAITQGSCPNPDLLIAYRVEITSGRWEVAGTIPSGTTAKMVMCSPP